MQRLPIIILLVLGVVATIVWFGYSRALQSSKATHDGRIIASTIRVDFGEIDPFGGPVSATIEIRNTGEGPLQINRVSTSCGCTTATMDTSALAPGENRPLTIQFDPQVHPDERGPITREVYVQSSDPDQPEVVIDVVGLVLLEKPL